MRTLSYLHPEVQDIVNAIKRIFPGTLTSTYRTTTEQAKLYRDFKAGRSRFPAEAPGASTHHTGLAFDYVVRAGSASAEQRELGEAWRDAGGRWNPGDVIHFEHPSARSILAHFHGDPPERWWDRSFQAREAAADAARRKRLRRRDPGGDIKL